MSVWHDILTVVRGFANELSEKLTDSFALNQLEGSTYAARKHLEEAQQHLQRIVRLMHQVKQDIVDVQKNITALEKHIQIALQHRDQQKAMLIAQRVAQRNHDLESQQVVYRNYLLQVRELKLSMYQTAQNIKTMRRESLALRATQSIQKARALSQHPLSSRESLRRIRGRQQQRQDYFQARMQVQRIDAKQETQAYAEHVDLVEVFYDEVDYKETLLDKVNKTQTQAMSEALHRVLAKK